MRVLLAILILFSAVPCVRAQTTDACLDLVQPVCGYKEKTPTTYANVCAAAKDGLARVTPGACSPTSRASAHICATVYEPVCGSKDGKAATYSNGCVARGEGAKVIHDGKCDGADESGGAKPQ